MRIYNPALGKFLSVDPLAADYPWYTPYQFAGNMPIYTVDIDGLEPEKILNEAERLLNTPYEFGGKNPSPEVVGMLRSAEGRSYWKKYMIPLLQLLYDYHPTGYKGKGCTEEELLADLNGIRKGIYKVFPEASKNGSLGIDCSGFLYKCYKQDQNLLMTINSSFSGSKGQLNVFKNAVKKNQAYVHTNFNLISAGDFIYHPGHVMIATGNVKKNQAGDVTEYETMEANSGKVGSVKMWRTVDKKSTIGHPFRTTDSTSCTEDDGKEKVYSAEERTKYNQTQTVVEQKK